jgi:tetratricopeptide (TPR) repeat protein
MGISGGLGLRLSNAEKLALAQHATDDPEAYELYLKARHAFATETEEGLLEARRLYRRAVEKDPGFAEAYLGVARTYASMAMDGYAPAAEVWPSAEADIQKALALEPGSVLVRCALTIRQFFWGWDWAGVDKPFRDLSDQPRVLGSDSFRPIALYFWARGQTEEAIAVVERALRVDPGNLISKNMLADFLADAGRLDEAIAAYRSAVESQPSNPGPLFGLADTLRRRGDLTGAIESLRKAYETTPGEEAASSALAAARTERDYEKVQEEVARFRLGELEALARERYVSPLDLARLYALVGEREKAFASLQAAYAERSPGLVYLKVDRAWDRVRDDSRFAALVRRVGIP